MILSRRAQSNSINSELAPCLSPLASPPVTPSRGHKHSLSKPTTWLHRSSASTSTHSIPHVASKPTRISEPKAGSSLDQLKFHCNGQLGSGATIVRTPREALSGSTRAFELTDGEQGAELDAPSHNHTENDEARPHPPALPSPPLPPLPDLPDIGCGRDGLSASPTPVSSDHVSRSRSSGPPSPVTRSSSRPTTLAHSCVSSHSTPTPPVDIDMVLPQPPFEAILLSPIPDGPIDSSKLIVILETCTTTYRTSLRTLASRPSHLARYLTHLLTPLPLPETASVYSNGSDASLVQHSNGFSSIFRDHLASSGCLPPSPNTIHIFLDRPSAPYAHVLAYLRSLPDTLEQPEMLPRAVQLGSQSHARFESLLELGDEASYLGLDALHQLCSHEIHRVRRVTSSAGGSSTLRSKSGSVRSARTVIEHGQPHQEFRLSELRASKGSTGNARTAARSTTRTSSPSSSCENKDLLAVRERSRERRAFKHEIGSPPPGWI